MKTKTKAIVVCACVAGVISAALTTGILIAKRNEGAKTPSGWCVEQIKEIDEFEKNGITDYVYKTNEAYCVAEHSDFNKYYFIEIIYEDVYGSWYEKWFGAIAYKKTIWKYLKKEQVVAVECEMLARTEWW